MRTTVELPEALLQAAKIRAAERGETLKELFTRAVEREITPQGATISQRVSLPLIASGASPTIDVSTEDIAAALAEGDGFDARQR